MRGMACTDPRIYNKIMKYSMCKEFGWTVEEYENTPHRELEIMKTILIQKTRMENEERKRIESRRR